MTQQQPMDAVTALRIICAEAVQAYYYREIKAGIREPLPANGLSYSKRQRVLGASGYRCNYCGSEGYLEVDHIWPRCKGGQHWMINLQALCEPCHEQKGTNLVLRSPEALAVLVPILGPALKRVLRWAWLVVAWIVALIAAHPVATAAVVGGTAAYFAVRWLRERDEVDGRRRYVRIGRAANHAARKHADRVREGATNTARGIKDRVGSVRVPVPTLRPFVGDS